MNFKFSWFYDIDTFYNKTKLVVENSIEESRIKNRTMGTKAKPSKKKYPGTGVLKSISNFFNYARYGMYKQFRNKNVLPVVVAHNSVTIKKNINESPKLLKLKSN